jgi:hypothetical protein
MPQERSVTVPAHLARQLALLANEGATVIRKRDGDLHLTQDMHDLLVELRLTGMASASGNGARTVGPASARWVSAREAAQLAGGISDRRVRQLAREGRLIARRAGRDWLVDADSAQDYGKGRNVA